MLPQISLTRIATLILLAVLFCNAYFVFNTELIAGVLLSLAAFIGLETIHNEPSLNEIKGDLEAIKKKLGIKEEKGLIKKKANQLKEPKKS